MTARPLFDPPRKTCQSTPGSILASENNIYIVESVLRRGRIGQLVKCSRIRNSEPVVIKMIKNNSHHLRQAQAEICILKRLGQLDPDNSHLVSCYQVFQDRAFTCLLFESLETNLWDFMKDKQHHSLSLNIIRPIIKQVASALHYLKSVDIIHANLKLENVMLVEHRSQPARVKVFDFSRAHLISAAKQGMCIQPLHYRSPEIILGLSYDAAVDVWSLGCITAALYLGRLLYRGKSTFEMLKYIVQIQGQPPDLLLNLGLKTKEFFLRDASSSSWRLKSHKEYFQKGDVPQVDNMIRVVSSLQDFLILRPLASHSPADKPTEIFYIYLFVALLKGMLHLDAAQRLTPQQVLQHPFITMPHPFSMAPPSAGVTLSLHKMKTSTQPVSSSTSSSSRGQTTIKSQFRPENQGANERGSFSLTSSILHESKPTKQALKRKMSQEPKIVPHKMRVHLPPGLSSSA